MARIPIIIDTDPGVDDIVALLLALASPEIEIAAIVCTFGNTSRANAKRNLLKMYAALEAHFAACPADRARFVNYNAKPWLIDGADEPVHGEGFQAAYFHGQDGLSDIATRHPTVGALPEPPDQYAARHFRVGGSLRDVLHAFDPHTLVYLSLGPVSTLARLLQADKQLFMDRIGRVISMGGAIDAPGNTSPVAEFNIFADPTALHILLHSGLGQSRDGPRWLILPLDITSVHAMPFADYRNTVDPTFSADTGRPSQAQGKSPLVHFSSAILEQTAQVMAKFGSDVFELHDPTALWCALACPPSTGATDLGEGWQVERKPFDVERGGHLTRGMLVVDRRVSAPAENGRNRTESHAAAPMKPRSSAGEQPEAARAIEDPPAGFEVVVATPGSDALLRLMYERIWGLA